jgi:hypothetical protein
LCDLAHSNGLLDPALRLFVLIQEEEEEEEEEEEDEREEEEGGRGGGGGKTQNSIAERCSLWRILSNLGTFASTLPIALLCTVRSAQFYTHGTNWSVPHQKLQFTIGRAVVVAGIRQYAFSLSLSLSLSLTHTHTHTHTLSLSLTICNTHQYNPPVTPRYSRLVSSFCILGIKFVPSSKVAYVRCDES